jgi:hypothetical protein
METQRERATYQALLMVPVMELAQEQEVVDLPSNHSLPAGAAPHVESW